MSSRETSHRSATFSAVSPIGMYTFAIGASSPKSLGCSSSCDFGYPSTCVIDSTPAATYASPSPARIAWNAMRIVWSDDAQKRLTVVPGTVSGSPASSAARRPRFIPCRSCGKPQPTITSATSSRGRTGTCFSAASIAKPTRSSGRASTSEPFRARPIGVRAAATMTASRIGLTVENEATGPARAGPVPRASSAAVDERAELAPGAVAETDQLELRERESIARARRDLDALERVRVRPVHPLRGVDERLPRRVFPREVEEPDGVVRLREAVVVERVPSVDPRREAVHEAVVLPHERILRIRRVRRVL